jgi:hypothetical protein
MKVDTDVIVNITLNQIGQAVILVMLIPSIVTLLFVSVTSLVSLSH